MQLYTFADYARATAFGSEIIDRQSNKLSSIGIGLRVTLIRRFNLDIQGAQARRDLVIGEDISTRFNLNMLMAF